MNNNILNNEKIKIYNGTNHDITLYNVDTDSENFQSNRYGSSYILVNPELQPQIKIEQQNPLNAKCLPISRLNYGGISFKIPDYIYPIEQFVNAENYDVIIVSQLYAQKAIEQNLPRDFVDRLYIVDKKIRDKTTGRLIGNGGLQKARQELDIGYYLNAFENGRKPSLVSAELCLNYYKTYFPYARYAEAARLEKYIKSEELNRRYQSPSAFKRIISTPIFNV